MVFWGALLQNGATILVYFPCEKFEVLIVDLSEVAILHQTNHFYRLVIFKLLEHIMIRALEFKNIFLH